MLGLLLSRTRRSPHPSASLSLCLSLPLLLKLRSLLPGEGKKEILKAIFDSKDGRSLPSALVNQVAGDKVTWFTDSPANQGVDYASRST
ncbi:6-phosphogluconolactonase [Penicillium lividum]|nr:6-phosphogluconolactonase [Penicillium lividum]